MIVLHNVINAVKSAARAEVVIWHVRNRNYIIAAPIGVIYIYSPGVRTDENHAVFVIVYIGTNQRTRAIGFDLFRS